MAISQIPTLRAHIWFLLWQLLCGRPNVGRSSPLLEWSISQITSVRAHLLWQLICSRPSVGRSTLPQTMIISQIPTLKSSYLIFTLTAPMWQTKCRQIYPYRMAISQIATLRAHLLWQIICGRLIIGRSSIQSNDFTNSYSESSYLIPTLTAPMWQTKCREI